MSLAIRISRIFPYAGNGNLKAFFNADFGYETDGGDFVGLFSVNDFSLFTTKAGNEYFLKGYARPRIRNGAEVKGDDGYTIRDSIFNRYIEQAEDGSWKPTKASYKFTDLLLSKAVEAYEAKLETLQVPANANDIEEDEVGVPMDAEDDDFPF